MKKYVQNHCVPALPPDSPLIDQVAGGDILRRSPDIDGVVELYFDDLESWYEAYNGWYLSPGGDELREDEVKLLDMGQIRFFISQPVVIKDLTQQA